VVYVVLKQKIRDAFLDGAELIVNDGVAAALGKADAGAAAEAEKDRLSLLDEQGDDVNASEQKVDLIRKL